MAEETAIRKPVILLPMSKQDTTVARPVRNALRMVFMSAITQCETFESVEDQVAYLTEIQEWVTRNLANIEGLASGAKAATAGETGSVG